MRMRMRRRASKAPRRTALISISESQRGVATVMDYGDLASEVARVARGLRDLGVSRGRRHHKERAQNQRLASKSRLYSNHRFLLCVAAAAKRRCPRQGDTPAALNYSTGGAMARMISTVEVTSA